MSLPIARILHFNFETAEDLNLWVMKYETETSELAKEAIQRTLVKTDETSLVICNIYHNEEDANNVLERLSKWSGTVKATQLGKVSISQVKLCFQSQNINFVSYFSCPSQTAKAPVMAPVTVAVSAVA